VRSAIEAAGRRIFAQPQCFDPQAVARIKEMSQLHVTNEYRQATGAERSVRLPMVVAANGANFLVVQPGKGP
jgi:hypothetical protein